jgi:hypothetical protein
MILSAQEAPPPPIDDSGKFVLFFRAFFMISKHGFWLIDEADTHSDTFSLCGKVFYRNTTFNFFGER